MVLAHKDKACQKAAEDLCKDVIGDFFPRETILLSQNVQKPIQLSLTLAKSQSKELLQG
jgi:hypothetical protein